MPEAVRERVPAVGGTRTVPAPDPVARDYLLLGLRLDQHLPGLVDGYFGPADLKARTDMEQRRAPGRLRDDAIALRERLAGEVDDPDRGAWLDAQLVALETHAASLAGDRLPFLDEVERCFTFRPHERPEASFDAAAARLDELLPGDGPLADRLDAWDRRLEIPRERLAGVVDGLVAPFRERARTLFGLPAGEELRVSFVSGQSWGAYDWYDGGRRSRVDINTDRPITAPDLVRTVAHETYPGHHLEHAWKEADLVDGRGRLEASILLLNTPECLISEGLANLAWTFAVPSGDHPDLLVEVFERAGLALAADPAAARDSAVRAAAMTAPRAALSAIRGNAAIRRHGHGHSHDEVLRYLHDVGRIPPARTAGVLEFIEAPLWRTYAFVYAEGEALLRRWLEAVPAPDRSMRFGRLLTEALTPAMVTVPA